MVNSGLNSFRERWTNKEKGEVNASPFLLPMSDFRRFPDGNSRQLISFDRFVSLTGEKLFLCLDKGIIEIARYLLNSRGSWRTTYVKEYVGTIGYNMPTLEEFQIIERAIAEANVDMSSCEDIVEALEGIGNAIAQQQGSSSGCGCPGIPGSDRGTAGANTSTATPSGNESQYGNPGSPPLPGFETKEESDSYQCSMAHRIFNDLLHDISVLTTLSVVGVLATELAAIMIPLLFTPIAWVDLFLLAAVVIQAFAVGLAYTSVIDHLETNENEYICAILSGTDVNTSIDNFKAKVQELVDEDITIPGDLLKYTATSLINAYATIDSFNRLYERVAYSLPEEVCDCACVATAVHTLEFGVIDGEDTPGYFVVSATNSTGWSCGTARNIAIKFDKPVTVTPNILESTTGAPALTKCGTDTVFHFYSGPNYDGTVIFEGDTHSGSETNVQSMYILAADEAFKFEFTVCDV